MIHGGTGQEPDEFLLKETLLLRAAKGSSTHLLHFLSNYLFVGNCGHLCGDDPQHAVEWTARPTRKGCNGT